MSLTEAMTSHSPKTKRCPECRRSVEACSLRPLSRTRYGSGIRYACPDCYSRVKELRKVAREARGRPQ